MTEVIESAANLKKRLLAVKESWVKADAALLIKDFKAYGRSVGPTDLPEVIWVAESILWLRGITGNEHHPIAA